MSVVDSLERVADWLRENVCQEVLLKPADPDDRAARTQTAGWAYELVHPSVHVLYVPSNRDRPPDMRATVPAILLQLEQSEDDLLRRTRLLRLRLSFVAYDPGTHGPDVLSPVEGRPGHYRAGEPGTFAPTHDGWRDAWNFMDRALREIECAEKVGGLAVDRGEGVALGDYEYSEAEDELYPFWLCWCRLTLLEPLDRARDVETFL